MLLATLQTQTSFAFAQGVRDRCAVGECGGGEISPWFYAFLLGIFLHVTFYKLFWGRSGAVNHLTFILITKGYQLGDQSKHNHTLYLIINYLNTIRGRETGIRTLGTLAGTTDFESVPFDHSGTSPNPAV